MKYCPGCGAANRVDARFCQKCGRGLPPARVARPLTPGGFLTSQWRRLSFQTKKNLWIVVFSTLALAAIVWAVRDPRPTSNLPPDLGNPTPTTVGVTPPPSTDSPTPPVVTVTPAPPSGPEAPDFTLKTVDGQEVALHDYQGKFVLLNFWATWCGPCRDEMPDLQRSYKRHEAENFIVLGVSIDDANTGSEVSGFVQEYGITYPILLDPDSQVLAQYRQVAPSSGQGIPTSYFINPDGVICDQQVGSMVGQSLENRVTQLLTSAGGCARVAAASEFQDDFSDSTSGWGSSMTPQGERQYVNGEYQIIVKEAQISQYQTAPNLLLANATITVEVRPEPGSQGYFGIVFGLAPDTGERYEFAMRPSDFRVNILWVNQEGEAENMANWQPVNNALTDGSANLLQITVEDGFADLYVNGHLIKSVRLKYPLPGGGVGLFACTCDGTDNANAYFDNFAAKAK